MSADLTRRDFTRRDFTRRQMLARCANGFGALALTALLEDSGFAGGTAPSSHAPQAAKRGVRTGPFAPKKPHHEPRATSMIFLYMDGGPSQIDTFDPKPRLTREDGQPFKAKKEPTQFNNDGNTLGSPWKFHHHGESGIPVSELFPHVAKHVDELCVIRSMVADFSEHTNANYFLHTGLGLAGRPSVGSWVSYGIGSENQNLPGFVVLNGGLVPPGGLDNFSNGFLPATYQGSIFLPRDEAVANIRAHEPTAKLQRNKLDLLRRLDSEGLELTGPSDPLESAIANYELAFRMQSAVPELTSIDGETEATQRMYGLESLYEPTRIFGRQCLLARRLVERGVRFIELTCPKVGGDRWDQHSGLKKGHENNARAVDQPIGALLADLRARGLLDSTLILWAGEFGRTPFAQGRNGRDHNPFGFTVWLAGGGARPGTIYGATDEFGYKAIENKLTMYDLHANILHLLGIDHEKLTVRFSGRDMRLTDVHGELFPELWA